MINKIKNITKYKLLLPMFIGYTMMSCLLYVYIPEQLDNVVDEYLANKSVSLIHFLESSKTYYSKYIVDDISKHNNGLIFKVNHKDSSDILPPPAVLMKDLAHMSDIDTKVELYSSFPFENQKDRILTRRQKKILVDIQKTPSGIITEELNINGKRFLRISKANYMSENSCIDCHNSHISKTWSNDFWSIGDFRGVIEITTPMDTNIYNSLKIVRNNIISIVLFSFLILFGGYGFFLIKREEELKNINIGLDDRYTLMLDKMKMKNSALEDSLDTMFEDFDQHVIYSTTNLFGVITEASTCFADMSGHSKDDLIGKPHSIIRHEDMPGAAFKEMWQTLKANKTWSGEVKNKTKSGGYYWVHAVISPKYDSDGVKIGYTAIRKNITEKKDLELKNLKLKLKG